MTAAKAKAAEPEVDSKESPEAEAEAKPAAKKKGTGGPYKATGLIQVPVGNQVLQFLAGDILPDGIVQDAVDHLLDNGSITESE